MNPLPVVQRELIAASRRTRTFRVRMVSALIGTASAAGMILFGTLGGGHGVFLALSWIAFVGCSLSGVFLTADCLRSEKREGTLGLLFLTDLNGYDIVFGKLAMAGCSAAMALLALIPVFSVGWLLGGVTAGEFWRMALVLVLTLTLSLSVGLAVSTRGRDQAAGVGFALLWILVFVALFPAIASAAAMVPGLAFVKPIFELNPLICFTGAEETLYSITPHYFQRAAPALALWTLLALGFACWSLPRGWRDDPSAVERGSLWHRLAKTAIIDGSSAGGVGVVRKLLDKNPILALEARAPNARALAWLLAGIVGMSATVYFILDQRGIPPSPFTPLGTNASTTIVTTNGGMVTTTMTYSATSGSAVSTFAVATTAYAVEQAVRTLGKWGMELLFAWQACGLFCNARRTGLIELIATTPMTDMEMLFGHWQALFRLFAAPTAVMVIADLCYNIQMTVHGLPLAPILIGSWALSTASTGLAYIAMAWAGTWHSLNETERPIAFLKTLGWVFVPALLCGGCVPLVLLIVISSLRSKFWLGVRRELVGPANGSSRPESA
jgi:hypothetical protein